MVIATRIESDKFYDNVCFGAIQQYKKENFSGLKVFKSNLNGAIFFESKFNECAFDSCDLSNLRFFQVDFRGCVFVNCDMRSLGIRDVIFEKCRFEKCDFRGVNLDDAKWSSCDLKNCKFRDLDLHSWHWVGCSFSGVLREIRFFGKNCSKYLIDFSAAKFDAVDFVDCDISDCVPPTAKHHYFVHNLIAKISKSEDVLRLKPEGVRKVVERRLGKLRGMNSYIVNSESLRKIEGGEVASSLLEIFGITED